MCGICGFTLSNDAPDAAKAIVDVMSTALQHRGPDGSGSHIEPGIVLGHRRLSIIDLQGGAQPMRSADGTIAVTFNGEIYNFKELRGELRARGHVFQTESDTEVILYAYREFGESFLSHLNGMFAFGLWDQRKRQLILARDRMGEKPLYYAVVGEQLVFASELKSLRQFPGIDLELDVQALDDYLSYGYVPVPRTIYKGVRKLPHAHYLVWRDGRFDVRQYWDGNADLRFNSLSEAVDQFRELLDDSIRIRLRSDVPVGAFLSGGTDSTLIVARSSAMYPGTLQTFTIGFGEAEFDESGDASITANRFGTSHTSRMVEAFNLSILPELVRQYDEPFADPSALPTYYVTREASTALKVCLSGDGADELFGGYPQYRLEPLEQTMLRLPRRLRKALLAVPNAVLPDHVRGKGWLSRMVEDGARRYQQKLGVFTADERKILLRDVYRNRVDTEAGLFEPYFHRAGREIENRQRTDRQTYLPDDILVKVDRSSMAHSLEVRTPYLDHRLVEFAAALPMDYLINGTEQKRILREVLRTLVPNDVLARRKQGFALPIRDWFRNEHRDFVADRLLQSGSRIFDFVEPDAVSRLVTNHNRGQRDFSDRIWCLLWLEEWFGQFG